jgi:hypothetical protein
MKKKNINNDLDNLGVYGLPIRYKIKKSNN